MIRMVNIFALKDESLYYNDTGIILALREIDVKWNIGQQRSRGHIESTYLEYIPDAKLFVIHSNPEKLRRDISKVVENILELFPRMKLAYCGQIPESDMHETRPQPLNTGQSLDIKVENYVKYYQ